MAMCQEEQPTIIDIELNHIIGITIESTKLTRQAATV